MAHWYSFKFPNEDITFVCKALRKVEIKQRIKSNLVFNTCLHKAQIDDLRKNANYVVFDSPDELIEAIKTIDTNIVLPKPES